MNNKTWYIHRTSRKSKCELYITKFEGDVFKMEYETICNYVKHYKDKIAYFTMEEAIKYRDLLNQFRKGKRYLWVVSNDISKSHEDNTKVFKIDMEPVIPSHPTADETNTQGEVMEYESLLTKDGKAVLLKDKNGILYTRTFDAYNEGISKGIIKDNDTVLLGYYYMFDVFDKESKINKTYKENQIFPIKTADEMFEALGYVKDCPDDNNWINLKKENKNGKIEIINIVKATGEFGKYIIRKGSIVQDACLITEDEHKAINEKLKELEQEKRNIYIRFGEIPVNEQSKNRNGCSGDGHKWVGYENGVSVWNAVKLDDGYHLVPPNKSNSYTYGDFSRHAFPDETAGFLNKQSIFVVTGTEVGRGSDNEPLIKNVKILKELPSNYFSSKH